MNRIHVALSSDRNYARQLAVTIASILANAGPDDVFSFHIVDLGLTEECRMRIESLRQIRDFRIEYLPFPVAELEAVAGCPLEGMSARYGYPGAVFGRVFLPDLLPDLPRVLYLDCDLVALGSLNSLWDTDFEGKYAVCARDALEYLREAQKDVGAYFSALGIREGSPYFNSGVMLLNLDKARKRSMKRRFFALLEQYSQAIKSVDQDVFNILFQGDYIVVPSMWNFPDPMSKWSEEFTFASTRFTPKIIHYTTGDKPWKKGNGCAHADVYRRYAAMTGWDLPSAK